MWVSGCTLVILLTALVLILHAQTASITIRVTPPTSSNSTGYVAPTSAIGTSNPLDQAEQTCQEFPYFDNFITSQSVTNVILDCYLDLPTYGIVNVEFGETGQIYLNSCFDSAWVTANNDQQSLNCGAPTEPVSDAIADCQSGAYFSPDGSLAGTKGTWSSKYELCLVSDG